MIDLELDPRHDPSLLAQRFERDGRVTIEPFVSEACALELYQNLRSRGDWRQVIISGERLVELDRETQASLTAEQREGLDQAVYASARSGFQARYETIRVPDEADARAESEDLLARVAEFLSRGAVRDFLRCVTNEPAISYADLQGTAYSPGHFLTGHDDAFEGKHRVAAYVLGLTPVWRIEWGGLLLFHQEGDTRGVALAPGFNQLNLFRVGQQHSVTEVTRAAAYRRYSLTGWLRADR